MRSIFQHPAALRRPAEARVGYQGKGAAIQTGTAMATGMYLLAPDAGHPHRILFFWHYSTYKIQLMTVHSAFQKVVALRAGHRHAIPLTPYDLSCISLAHQLLSKDLSPRTTIDALALEIGINRNKLNYGFKYVYGLTINEFQEKLRMEKAELLLSTTRKSVKAIASLTHYCTPSRFGVVFKKTYGITPLQFRKQLKSTRH